MVIVTAENKMGFLKNYRTTLIKKKKSCFKLKGPVSPRKN